MSSLPTPPLEDHQTTTATTRRSKLAHSKSSSASRSSKRSPPSHHDGSVMMDGRHKRVWKACERCRMKKTKCDGESPCKRCKDDGLVCTAGSRKKTEFKQLPRGYAEVLENTQYALIATVQKLYTMIRNNESWDLGEPELNDRGLPVIHDIASKLGCIRPSPDLPYAFPEGADDFAELQLQLQAARAEMGAHDIGGSTGRKGSESVSSSPALDRTDRASSSESDHSSISKDYNQMLWAQQQQQQQQHALHAAAASAAARPHHHHHQQQQQQQQQQLPPPHHQQQQSATTTTLTPLLLKSADPSNLASFEASNNDFNRTRTFETVSTSSIPSPVFTEFRPSSPLYRNASPFSPWSGGADEFLGQAHALDLTAHYMRQQQQYAAPRSAPIDAFGGGLDADLFKVQMGEGFGGVNGSGNGTIRPNMLDCSTGPCVDQMENVMFGTSEFEQGMLV